MYQVYNADFTSGNLYIVWLYCDRKRKTSSRVILSSEKFVTVSLGVEITVVLYCYTHDRSLGSLYRERII